MKAVILAGGLGTRISEESTIKPKPMIEIGGKPILWHILKTYSSYGINDFIICCGYKGYVIKEYFNNYLLHMSDVTIDFCKNQTTYIQKNVEPWKITLIDTGEDTMTGGRILRVKDYLKNEPAFCLTYGDGVANIKIDQLIDFHFKSGKYATITAVFPPGRFGSLLINEANEVEAFVEKPKGDGGMINGGFFVLSPNIFDYIKDDTSVWEKEPLENLVRDNQLSAYKHEGFWQPMDTLRDKHYLESLWAAGKAEWKIW